MFENANVGDEVIWTMTMGSYRSDERRSKIIRLTKTQVIIAFTDKYQPKFRRDDGHEIGYKNKYGSSYIEPVE